MDKKTVACRVCGKQFVPCNKLSSSLGAFNYHSVACSPECGEEYFRRVLEARNEVNKSESTEIEGQIILDEFVDDAVINEVSEGKVKEDAKAAIKTTHFKKNR